MSSLQLACFYRITEDVETAEELVSILESNPAIQNVADQCVGIWIEFLCDIMSGEDVDEICTLRGDLKSGSKWREFYTGLAKKITYSYSLFMREDGKQYLAPSHSVEQCLRVADFTIQSILPPSRTPTVCGMLMSRPGKCFKKSCLAFGTSERDALENAISWILEICLKFRERSPKIKFRELDLLIPEGTYHSTNVINAIAKYVRKSKNHYITFRYTKYGKRKTHRMIFSQVILFPQ